jgi:iron complex transport system substrate-binding protein
MRITFLGLWLFSIVSCSLHADSVPRHAYIVGGKARIPARIVSLAPTVTEIIFALGLSKKLVGVTRFCDRPTAAKKIPKIGGFIDPQLEAILVRKPDLVIAIPLPSHLSLLKTLQNRGVATIVGYGDRISEIFNMIDFLGKVLGASQKAIKLTMSLKKELASIKNQLAQTKLRVAIVVGTSPLVLAGNGTYPNELLEHLGAKSIVSTTDIAWPIWSNESLLHANPGIIIVTGGLSGLKSFRMHTKMLWPKEKGPKVIAAKESFLERPGPSLAADAKSLLHLLRRANAS